MKKIIFIVIALLTISITAQNENSNKTTNSGNTEEDSGGIQALIIPPDPGDEDTYPWNRDADGDGYGNPNLQIEAATQPPGYVANNSDCDDTDSSVYPGALEVCDGLDNDCDGYTDEGAPSTPFAPTITNNCGSTILTRGTPPSGITWYWQSIPTGKSTSNSSTTVTLTSGTVYYLRARNNTTGCWSSPRNINYTVNTIPSTPSTPTITNNCGSTVLTRGTPPSGETYYWQSSSTGTSTSNSNTTITLTSGTVYYLRARNNTSGCWSSSRTINYTINTLPAIPNTPTITNNCGSTVLTRVTPPSGITWYWQSSSTGTSTSNANTTITLTSGTAYYLRAKNNTTGCWSSSKSISYTVNTVPSIPSSPTITNNCGSTVLTRSTPPAGITWYWQSSSTGTSTSNSNTTITLTSGTEYFLRARNNATLCWSSVRSINYTVTPPTTWYADTDGDSYGDPNVTLSQCTQPAGYVSNGSDYDDSTTNITNIAPQTFYKDIDDDSFGDPNDSVYYSVKPSGYVTNNLDKCPEDYGTNNGCDYYEPNFSNENYIYTRVYQEPILDPLDVLRNKEVSESITYFDGLGRPMQQIGIKQSPDTTDIITHITYDAYGRQDKDYLPYVPIQPGNEGSYRTDDQEGATIAYYNLHYPDELLSGSENPYSKKQFETSPLNRVLKQAAPGEDWRLGNGNEIEFDYKSNDTLEVRLFTVTLSTDNNYTPTLNENGYYLPNMLYKNITRDENHSSTTKNHTTEEFKDKQGRVVLKRTYADMDLNDDGDTNDTGETEVPHDTYYVYDDYGNLTYVLPPKMDGTTNDLATINSQLNDLGYQYKYDKRNRLMEKKIPGKDWEFIIYNLLDQPVLTQDGNGRTKSPDEWIFTKYDAFGRLAYTGRKATDKTRSSYQEDYADDRTKYTQYETKESNYQNLGGVNVYYSNLAIPTGVDEIYTISYYDNYEFDLPTGLSSTVTTGYEQTSASDVTGLATGTKVKVLGTSNWITTITYYDDKGRPIYVYTENEYLGTIDIIENNLDFVGKVKESTTTHKKTGELDIVTVEKFDYDHAGRLLTQTHNINEEGEEILVSNEYDDLGQLVTKGVGGETDQSRLQTVNYTYNIRGWLKNINQDVYSDNDLFNFTIMYNDIADTSKKLFNGNISQTSWNTLSDNTTGNPISTQYTYTYDALNRITSGIDNTGNYNLTSVAYDKNGNITNLSREGHLTTAATSFGTMDNLGYYYSGNQLHSVTDSSGKTTGFNDGNSSDTVYNNGNDDYKYDVNGNLVKDLNKGIGTSTTNGITYNHLNLPETITINNNPEIGTILYIYDATGVKLRKVVNNTVESSVTTTDYVGNYVYENDQLQFFNHPEGYVTPDGSGGFDYAYQYKDQLGNIRLSYSDADNDGQITASTEIIEESNYYPFGLIQKGYNNDVSSIGNSLAQKFNFGGNELSQELGLNSYDFGVRNYDPALGRWFNIDPLAEFMRNQSPYNYGFNNPIYFSDDGGNIPWPLPEIFDIWRRKAEPDEYFGYIERRKRNHYGLDLNYNGGKNTDLGAPIVATHSGRVARIFPLSANNGGGRIVVIQSLDGTLETKYMHLSSIVVKEEQEISEGQTIGLMGRSANGKDLMKWAHLHYEIHVNNGNGFEAINPWVNGRPIDPQRLISTYGPWADPSSYDVESDYFNIFDFKYEPKTPLPPESPDPKKPGRAITPGGTKPIIPVPGGGSIQPLPGGGLKPIIPPPPTPDPKRKWPNFLT